ncbi:MAG: Helix-turn-helix domain of resolvase [Alphaproteobacteria bacterium]|nr:Helix-turn-helix domain of resolvase [Alphaproteobacteria bacterium]
MMSARARGRHLGRPRKLNDGQIALAMKQVGRSSVSISVTAARLGVSRATVYRALKRTGVAADQRSKSRVAHVTRDN